jgi:hypothetical protein
MSIFVRWTRAALGAALLLVTSATSAQFPNLINYQGFVAVSGASFTGSGHFRFALVNPGGTTTYWSNDGTSVAGSQPTTAVNLAVSGGVFSVVLGDVPMTAIPASVFTSNSDVRLRVWFDDGSHGVQQLSPDQRVVAAAYAIAVDPDSTTLTSNFFKQGGNPFGGIATLGTTDNNALEVRVNGMRVMRYEPNTTTPNVIGGHVNDGVYIGVVGASIGGGGAAGAQNATVLGYICLLGYGCLNGVTDAWGTIGGGAGNQAGNGVGATTDAAFATVAGGFSNWAQGNFSSVGGGRYNTAAALATVGGGDGNTANGYSATVSGGVGNIASGTLAVVPGGYGNQALGDYSFAAGTSATIPASAPGTFFWNDSTGPQSLPANSHDVFIAIATNGIGLYTYKDFSHGCVLLGAAGSWTCTSDRATKSDFTAIEPRDILARVVEMPITQWRWKGETEGVRHVGPMAQDFRAAFGLGHDDKTITQVDIEGIALAAIQGLNAKVEAQSAVLADRDARIAALESQLAEIRRAVEMLAARSTPELTVARR